MNDFPLLSAVLDDRLDRLHLRILSLGSETEDQYAVLPHRSDLAQMLGVSVKAVSNHISDLRRYGYKIATDKIAQFDPLVAQEPETHSKTDGAVRAHIWHLSDGKCVYCDVEVPLADMELDHFVPKSAGGPDNMSNYVCSCRPCNQTKRDKHPINFIRQRLGHNVVRFNPNTEVA